MAISVTNTDAGLSGTTLVNAESAQTVTGLKTFDRDPNPPFAVSSGSAVVPNLDADKVDGVDIGTLAANRVPYASGATALTNSANLTFDGSVLTAAAATISGLLTIMGLSSTDGHALACSGSGLTLANDATDTFANLGTASFLFIYEGTNTGDAAIFAFHNNGESIVWQNDATTFSTTIGTASRCNIAAAGGTVTIENKLGSTSNFRGFFVRLS